VDWIHLAQNRVQWWSLVNTVMNLPVPFLDKRATVSFERRTLIHGGSCYAVGIIGKGTGVYELQTGLPCTLVADACRYSGVAGWSLPETFLLIDPPPPSRALQTS
jgi:hypothetical protein